MIAFLTWNRLNESFMYNEPVSLLLLSKQKFNLNQNSKKLHIFFKTL